MKQKEMKQIITSNDEILTSTKDILDEKVRFYKNMYTSKYLDVKNINEYISNTNAPILDESDADLCNGVLTEKECKDATVHMNVNKSPGPDGIPLEFYRCFWEDIKVLLVHCLNDGYTHKELSSTQKCGIINVIHKKGDVCNLSNWRPISPLNVGYQIAAHALAKRIQKVIHKVVKLNNCYKKMVSQ